MSSPSHSPQSLPKQEIHESDVVSQDSPSRNLIQEVQNQPDSPSKPDPDPENQEEDDDDEEEEQEQEQEQEQELEEEGQEQEIPQNPSIASGMPLRVVPPITEPLVSVSDGTLASPPHHRNPRRGSNKRKKGKPNVKKQQSIEKKLQTLMVRFNPIPFIPHKILDFSKREKLLKSLGLWDFVHIDFDRTIRVDLIAQLVATYDPKSHCSYVNNYRISVNRGDFAHAFKLPLKKKGNIGGVEGVELDGDEVLEDSIGFIVEFVSDWVLLHEDTWMMPDKVMKWLKLIQDGHPEMVDWAGLFRFMVEKELLQGDQLRDCYYASHLQHLLKFKREEVFFRVELVAEKVEKEGEAKVEEEGVNEGDVMVGGTIDGHGEESCVMGGPSIELTLGQDGEKEGNVRDVEMMVAEKCKENDEDEDEDGGEEQGRWLLSGKNNLGEHFMQRCSVEDGQGFGSLEDRKEEKEGMGGDGEEDEVQRFDVFPTDDDLDGDGLTGNLLEAMETTQVAFNSQGQLRDPSSINIRDDMQHAACSPPFFNHAGKRVIEHDNDISHHSLNDSNKRMRINDSWNQKPVDFGTCMEQIQQMMERARMFYEEKEQSIEQSNVNQQILLNELQKRDAMIEHLHKTRLEEVQKKDGEIYRLQHELYLMGSVLQGYRKALKETQTVFAEYRQRAQLPEEPTYKDAGPGGLMLSTAEIEKICQKQEEEYKMNCLIVEQKMKEVEENYAGQFDAYVDKINILDKKLTGLESDAKELIQLYAKRKTPQTEEIVPEVAEPLLNE